MTKTRGARLLRRGVFTVLTAMMGLMATTITPASAVTALSGGVGLETMVGVPFSPSPPCANYTRYQANVTFPTVPPTNATITSDPGVQWNEGPDGTHHISDPCTGGIDAISGFHVTLLGGTTCVNVAATYKRVDVNITVTLLGTGNCSGTLQYDIAYVTAPVDIPPFFMQGDAIGLCNSPIAPSACLIAPHPAPLP